MRKARLAAPILRAVANELCGNKHREVRAVMLGESELDPSYRKV